jgi:hypothetical protein
MPKKNIFEIIDNKKFKLNLLGENDDVKFIGSIPGAIIFIICSILCLTIFLNLVISM